MRGLLDIFGTGGGDTLSLLGMSPEAIQRSRDDAQAQALYGLAGSLLSGGPTGLSIVRGLQQGSQAYKNAMQGQVQEQFQGMQVQDLLRKRKQEEEALALQQQARMRQQMIDRAVAGSFQPAQAAAPAQFYGQETQMPLMDDMGQMMPGATAPVAGRAAGIDLQSLAPLLMASPEGRKTLGDLVASQKALRPETFSLAEGAQQFERDPFTGQVRQVASGAPKPEVMPTSLREFMAAQENPAFAQFLSKQKEASAPKFAVNMQDPTAVAKAQSEVVKDWRGVVKDTGAMEVADRFKAARVAVEQGNAGNKAADGALIFAIGKIYDPSGAVQEGDKATILGNRSIPDSIKAYAQKAFSGQDLLPSERNGLLSVASQIVQSKAQNLEAQKAPYTSISRQLGGGGELLLNPLADVLSSTGGGDLAAQARAELARRREKK
jgi:hypothetical protein